MIIQSVIHTGAFQIKVGLDVNELNSQSVFVFLFFTVGPRVELCVQNLQGRNQAPLGVGRAFFWTFWTFRDHFLLFFVLHLRIDVEAWDLP